MVVLCVGALIWWLGSFAVLVKWMESLGLMNGVFGLQLLNWPWWHGPIGGGREQARKRRAQSYLCSSAENTGRAFAFVFLLLAELPLSFLSSIPHLRTCA